MPTAASFKGLTRKERTFTIEWRLLAILSCVGWLSMHFVVLQTPISKTGNVVCVRSKTKKTSSTRQLLLHLLPPPFLTFLLFLLFVLIEKQWDHCVFGSKAETNMSHFPRQPNDSSSSNNSNSNNSTAEQTGKEDWRDCLECKIVGTLSLSLAGGYLLYSRRQVPKSSVNLRRFMTGFAYTLFGLAAARAAV